MNTLDLYEKAFEEIVDAYNNDKTNSEKLECIKKFDNLAWDVVSASGSMRSIIDGYIYANGGASEGTMLTNYFKKNTVNFSGFRGYMRCLGEDDIVSNLPMYIEHYFEHHVKTLNILMGREIKKYSVKFMERSLETYIAKYAKDYQLVSFIGGGDRFDITLTKAVS